MQSLIDLGLNLAAAAIGALITWMIVLLRRWLRYRRVRGVWRSFIKSRPLIAVGRFFQFRSFEPSGFIGVGDANAMTELRKYFDEIGITGSIVTYADTLQGDDLKESLILLGGPDVNSLVSTALQKVRATLRLAKDAIVDVTNGERYSPQMRMTGGNMQLLMGKEARERFLSSEEAGRQLERSVQFEPTSAGYLDVSRDYALVIRLESPFDSSRQVIIVAGVTGFGTWGGIRYISSTDFITTPLVAKGKAIEALIQVDLAKLTPQRVKVLTMREIIMNPD